MMLACETADARSSHANESVSDFFPENSGPRRGRKRLRLSSSCVRRGISRLSEKVEAEIK